MMRRTKEPCKRKKIKTFSQTQAMFKTVLFEEQVNEWLKHNNVEILDMRFTASEGIMYGFIYYQEL